MQKKEALERVPGPNDRTVNRRSGIWGFIRRVFWGVDKEMPCFHGRQNIYVDHWLVGAHSWDDQPCE